MLVYYFLPFIVNNRYFPFQVSSGHNSVTVQNRTHVRMNFFAQNHSYYNFPKQCRFLLNHPVFVMHGYINVKTYAVILRSVKALTGSLDTSGGPPQLLAVTPRFQIGLQNTTFWQKNEIKSERTHNKIQKSVRLGHPARRSQQGPYPRHCHI